MTKFNLKAITIKNNNEIIKTERLTRNGTSCFWINTDNNWQSCMELKTKSTKGLMEVNEEQYSEEEFWHCFFRKLKLDPELEVGEVSDRLDSSAAKHKLSVRPRKKYADPRARNISRSSSDSNINRYVTIKKNEKISSI